MKRISIKKKPCRLDALVFIVNSWCGRHDRFIDDITHEDIIAALKEWGDPKNN